MDAVADPEPITISRVYTAVYSSVPVFEMMIQGVAIMRRRSDSYLNATQILKLAGMDKGKRTKILEREVLTGEHEKVQGGYGKYQGTWIPCDKGRELAGRYEVLDLILPLIEFDLSNLGDITEDENLPTKEQAIAAHRLQEKQQEEQERLNSPSSQVSPPASPFYTASPVASPIHRPSSQQNIRRPTDRNHNSRKKIKVLSSKTNEPPDRTTHSDNYRNVLMAIFFSDDGEQIPDLLRDSSETSSFNIDVSIDDQSHTALHWAAALARIKTVEVLLSKGANICRVNHAGETPLMRGVMVTNNFESDCFPKLLDFLYTSIHITDHKNRTVLHHTAQTAGTRGRTNAALYYMRHLLYIVRSNDQLATVIHQKDVNGDTAFTVAKKLGCKQMMDLLDPPEVNSHPQRRVGEPELYAMNEATTSDICSNKFPAFAYSEQATGLISGIGKRNYGSSQRGREIVSTVQRIVDALETEYGDKLFARDVEIQHVQGELKAVTRQLEEVSKMLEERQSEKQQLAEAHQRIRQLEIALHTGLNNISSNSQRRNIDSLDESEDIDALFNVNEPAVNEDIEMTNSDTKSLREKKLEQQVRSLQARIEAYTRNDEDLRQETEILRLKSAEKEMQCKRLIAACCNLAIEEVDLFIEPLAQAIESDPPDLELTRVIEFMERIRRQGITTDSSSTAQATSAASNNTDNDSVSNNKPSTPASAV
ncbi:transcriptional regulator swi6 [Apophysomyces sp. BC1034]|nr:transcriptional regulator swi6 [Apophysomyces sp. BC1015]KAG0179678.1 transcriptional regulator swi6 [Apophysomyces sp. BC1021]KAG0190165.1 transcriptional regulator swi6 [Apophysomyces sp. BC1034]